MSLLGAGRFHEADNLMSHNIVLFCYRLSSGMRMGPSHHITITITHHSSFSSFSSSSFSSSSFSSFSFFSFSSFSFFSFFSFSSLLHLLVL